jgi:hypothetical protein
MVQVLGLEPVAMPSAGEYRRYTKLRKPFDLLADEFVVPLTEDGDASDTADRPAFVALVQPCSFQGVTMLTVIAPQQVPAAGANRPHGLSEMPWIHKRASADVRSTCIGLRRGTAVGTMALARSPTSTLRGPKIWSNEVIVYCKAHPEIRIMEAIDVMLKQEKHQAVFK